MNISAPFIERPIATSLLMLSLIMAGLLAYRELPVSALPAMDAPVIQVTTNLPGAGPEIVASSVTAPLESRLSQVPGLVSIDSVTSYGGSVITLQFALSRNLDLAAQDVQAAISAAAGQLPRTLPNPPVYNKVNPADAPIFVLAVTSRTLPLPRINDLAETFLVQKLSQIDGVGLVSMGGNQKRSIRVQIDPVALASHGLSLVDIRLQIARLNVNAPKGNIDGNHQSFAIAVDDQVLSAERYRELVISHVNGAPVRLGDVAVIEEGVENNRVSGWHNGQPAIVLSIKRQPGANVIATVDRIKALLPQLRNSLPAALNVEVVSDRTEAIRASVAGVRDALWHSAIIVIGVIFVFLRRSWATVIPSTALPLSLIAALPVIYLAGFSVNNLTLMAATIAAGFVVDDAIVMVENIFRHIEAGKTPKQAALEGARQIGFTIVSLTVSLIAVFIPLLFMGGPIGRLLNEFAITLSVAVIASAVVSLTFTPMLCAHFLKSGNVPRTREQGRSRDFGFSHLADVYDRALQWALSNRHLVHGATALSIVATGVLFAAIPKGLLPQQDSGIIFATMDAADDISHSALLHQLDRVTQTILRDPDVVSVQSFTSSGASSTTASSAQMQIVLKPFEERHARADEIAARLDRELAAIVGVAVFMRNPQELTLDVRASRTQYQLNVQDIDASELARWAPQLVEALRQRPELADVASDQRNGGQQIMLAVNRDQASLLGISVQVIDDALFDAFGQRQISTIYTHQNQYNVILEAASSASQLAALDAVFLKSDSGEIIPLSVVVDRRVQPAPLSVTHLGRFPVVTISFNVAPDYSLGDAISAIRTTREQLAVPARVTTTFTGAAAEFGTSLENQPLLILAAIVIVYIVLGILYESYIHPITILSTLPSAGLGALSALMICGYELDLVSLIGIILLIGIVKKNAIMMIDFALDMERSQGATPEQSIVAACRLRFRPIMMTTLAALLGALPLALDTSIGYELRRPLGVAIIGGLMLSQLLTLFSTPVIYLFLARLSQQINGFQQSLTAAPRTRIAGALCPAGRTW